MIVQPFFTIGEVVRDIATPNAVYEIVGIVTSVNYNEEVDAMEELVTYAIVDIKVNTHITHQVIEDRLMLTDMDDVELYMANERVKDISELDEMAIYDKGNLWTSSDDYVYDPASKEDTFEPIPKSESIDDLLDEYNDYKVLISIFGDEDGYYKGRLAEIGEEIATEQGSN